MKVGKEEIVGLLAALKRYVRLDHEARIAKWEQQVALIVDALADIVHLRVRRVFPDYTGRPVPRAWLTWNEETAGLSKQMVLDALAKGSPIVRVLEEYAGKGSSSTQRPFSTDRQGSSPNAFGRSSPAETEQRQFLEPGR